MNKQKLMTELQSQGLQIVEVGAGVSGRKGGAGPSDHKAVTTVCQFCAIEQSLTADRTIARKTPAQLAEVAAAAVRLDGVKHMVMTSCTPNTPERGAAYLAECAAAIKQRVDLPIQAQCEPPDDFRWFQKLKDAGVDSLGMHLEAITPEVRAKIMPGKADVPVEYYFQAFVAAVEVFGRGQVSTYLLAGLGDTVEALVAGCDRLIQIGVYPFVVPFVPITGTPLAHPARRKGWQIGKSSILVN